MCPRRILTLVLRGPCARTPLTRATPDRVTRLWPAASRVSKLPPRRDAAQGSELRARLGRARARHAIVADFRQLVSLALPGCHLAPRDSVSGGSTWTWHVWLSPIGGCSSYCYSRASPYS